MGEESVGVGSIGIESVGEVAFATGSNSSRRRATSKGERKVADVKASVQSTLRRSGVCSILPMGKVGRTGRVACAPYGDGGGVVQQEAVRLY